MALREEVTGRDRRLRPLERSTLTRISKQFISKGRQLG